MLYPMNNNMIKIGITNDPHRRMKDLYSTSMPAPFKISHLWHVSDARRAEALSHDYFSGHRYNGKREFFEIYPGEQPVNIPDELINPLTNPYENGLEFIADKIMEVMDYYSIDYEIMDNQKYQTWYENGKKLFPNGPKEF
ncbi:MAG: GIY-YIG nuclease family protein [Colwellia sp.]|jgi:T5orf172 domain.